MLGESNIQVEMKASYRNSSETHEKRFSYNSAEVPHFMCGGSNPWRFHAFSVEVLDYLFSFFRPTQESCDYLFSAPQPKKKNQKIDQMESKYAEILQTPFLISR